MSNLLHKIEDKLSGKNKTATEHHDTTNSGIASSNHANTHTGAHTGTGLTGDHANTTGSGITGGTAVGGHHTNTGAGTLGSSHRGEVGGIGSKPHHVPGGTAAGHPTQHTDFIPGSHPAAQNPSSIPAAGGERVGSVPSGTGVYDSHTHDNRSAGEKIKDKIIPSRTDRPDDPLTGQNYGQHNDSSVAGNHSTTGMTGTHNTHNTNSLTGSHGTAATPLAHDSAFNERHTGPGIAGASHGLTGPTHAGTGLTGSSHTGPGLAGSNHTGPGLTSPAHAGSGYTGSTHTGSGLTGSSHTGPGLTGSSHAGQGSHLGGTHGQYAAGGLPDDSLTGSNVGQTSSTGQYHTGATGGSHIPGTAHSGQGSHLSNNTYGSGPTIGAGSTGVGSHAGTSGAYDTTPGTHTTTTAAKPSLLDKLNPKKDADRDGKAGLMD